MSAHSEPSLCGVNVIPWVGLYGGVSQPVFMSYLSITWSGKEISPGDIIIFAKKGEDTRGLPATTMDGDRNPASLQKGQGISHITSRITTLPLLEELVEELVCVQVGS